MRAATSRPGIPPPPGSQSPAAGALLALAGLLLWSGAWAEKRVQAGAAPVFSAQGPRTLTLLDPVNLASGLPDREAGGMLRRALAQNPGWRMAAGDSSARMLREYGLDPDVPCAEFQCAFDAGNALQTEFVLFGTATALPELHAFTLDLVHVPTSQVVWSRVGEIPKRPGSDRKQKRAGYVLEGSLQFAVADLDPASLELRKRPSLGLLGIMDAGQSTPHSRVAVNRALTHAYASRAYDLLGPGELEELMAALDIRGGTAAAAPGDPPTGPGGGEGMGGSGNPGGRAGGEDMLSLGTKMGVRYLLWTKVRPDGPEFRMDMTLYDVAGRKALRHWPARETADFGSLLDLEDRFMTVLGNGAPTADPRPAAPHSGLKTAGKIASITVTAAAAAALGFLAYRSKRNADAEYERFQDAQSQREAQEARTSVIRQDKQARHYGVLGGLSLALGVAVWAF
ncbi:MAG TPA: hypothetical protein VJ385_06080 [Fibrobacteria bacterium]|nr:hypothetical protein [Fibrobacteria bacterium]